MQEWCCRDAGASATHRQARTQMEESGPADNTPWNEGCESRNIKGGKSRISNPMSEVPRSCEKKQSYCTDKEMRRNETSKQSP